MQQTAAYCSTAGASLWHVGVANACAGDPTGWLLQMWEAPTLPYLYAKKASTQSA